MHQKCETFSDKLKKLSDKVQNRQMVTVDEDVIPFINAAGGDPEHLAAAISLGLRITPYVAEQSGSFEACCLISALDAAADRYPVHKAAFVDQAVILILALAKQSSDTANCIVATLIKATTDDPVRRTTVFNQGVAAIPAFVEGDNWTVTSLIDTLTDAAGDDPARRVAVFNQGIAVIPIVSQRDIAAASRLACNLAKTATGDPSLLAIFVDHGLAIVSENAKLNGYQIDHLVGTLAKSVGMGNERVVCREFMLAEGNGQYYENTVILFDTSLETTRVLVTGSDLSLSKFATVVRSGIYREEPRDMHGDIVSAAFNAFNRRNELPSFTDLARARLRQAPAAA